MTVVGICEIISQLCAASIGDSGWTSRIKLHQIYIAIMTLAVFVSTFLPQNVYVLMGCAGMMGFGAGAWQANILPVTADCLGIVKLRSAYGLCLFFSGIVGQLLGAPFIGFILDCYTQTEPVATSAALANITVSSNNQFEILEYNKNLISGYKLAFSAMGIILILAILVLQLEPYAKKRVDKNEKIKREAFNFEVTKSLQVDLNTLLMEFPRLEKERTDHHRKNSMMSTSIDGSFLLGNSYHQHLSPTNHQPNSNMVASDLSIFGIESKFNLNVMDSAPDNGRRKSSIFNHFA